ncbi:MAG: hypothetical protein HYV09_05515 [Deltaproteobacteria bacterium]|nr:hypothetical protein [Deltaproteobacteria bacterium]
MRSNPWLAVVSVLAGGALAVAASTAGCGGKTDDPGVTGPVDTGVTIVDSSATDTGAVKDTYTPPVDAEKTYDVPGSLFDAVIPDVVFEGGKTAGQCVACAGTQCKSEVEACDKDPRCRGLFLCVLTRCGASSTDYMCLLGCAGEYDVSSPSDPVVGKAMNVADCARTKCASECPAPPGDGGAGDAKADAKSDATGDAAETGAYMIFPSGAKPAMSIDPRVLEVLQSVSDAFANAELREGAIQELSH